MIVLSNNIRSDSSIEYRAILKQKDDGDVLVIQQKIDDEWFPQGQWFVSTLMEDPLRDEIYIDWGQRWKVSESAKRWPTCQKITTATFQVLRKH